MEVRGLGYNDLGRVKSQVAKERGGPGQDDVLPYLLEQILDMFVSQQEHRGVLHRGPRPSEEDHVILRKHMDVESESTARSSSER